MTLRFVSYGGGVQSTALLVLAAERRPAGAVQGRRYGVRLRLLDDLAVGGRGPAAVGGGRPGGDDREPAEAGAGAGQAVGRAVRHRGPAVPAGCLLHRVGAEPVRA